MPLIIVRALITWHDMNEVISMQNEGHLPLSLHTVSNKNWMMRRHGKKSTSGLTVWALLHSNCPTSVNHHDISLYNW